MPTIKDIAKAAGVSHGTVSNVLNGKGNVSAEKIELVKRVAREMGYIVNENAKSLRNQRAKSIAIILPNIEMQKYRDFYLHAKYEIESKGYTVLLYTTDDIVENERKAIKAALSDRVSGIITISCACNRYDDLYNHKSLADLPIVFAERDPDNHRDRAVATFDFKKCAHHISQYIIEKNFHHIALFTSAGEFSHEQALIQELMRISHEHNIRISHFTTTNKQMEATALSLFENKQKVDLIITSYIEQAEALLYAHFIGSMDPLPPILTISSYETIKNNMFIRYELDYKKLGKLSAQEVFNQIGGATSQDIQVSNDGFAQPAFFPIPNVGGNTYVQFLTLNSPSARVLQRIVPLCEKQTGIKLRLTILSENDLYESITSGYGYFDIIRMDVAWLHDLAEFVYTPLTKTGKCFDHIFDNFLENLPSDYTTVNGIQYALPFDPSTLILFYRKDLFENQIYKRMYYEKYHKSLAVPTTFEDYNKIASFFTKSCNKNSPTEFGIAMAMGLPSSVACEFLLRLFSFGVKLIDSNGKIQINTPEVLKVLNNHIESFSYSNKRDDMWWLQAAKSFADGNAAMCTVFTNHASDIISQHHNYSYDMIGFAHIPGNSSLLGGGVIGISRNCKNVDAAFTLIEWLYSKEISSMITYLGGLSPCKNVYNNCDILARYPWLKVAKESFASSSRHIANVLSKNFSQKKFENIIGMAIRNAILGLTTPEQALEYAQSMCDKLFHD